ncbi:MAG: bifunctional RNase H/acid phosphatase [Actinobacteria bacterium]|nr:bifunctional RNase H/acid phosphatase [Actinomycetota bacterium]
MPRALRIEADGGSRGNPGVAGYGAVVLDESGAVLAERAAPLGQASNNVAEYSGLIAGLEAARAIDPGARISVAMDSKLVVEQMAGRWKIKHEDMRRLALQAKDLVKAIVAQGGSVAFEWIPRERNKKADKLSNDGMDGLTIERDPWRGAETGSEPAPPEAPEPALAEVSEPGAEAEAGGPAAGDPALEDRAPADASRRASSSTASRGRGEPTRIVLVRHGATEFTEQFRLDGRGGADPSLSALGRGQAERAAELVGALLAGAPANLTTSTLARAVETGAVIAARLGLTPATDPAWDEQNFGDWDGVAMPELLRTDPEAVDSLRSDPAYRRPGGESHEELTQRVRSAYSRLVAGGGTHVVVCHRKPILVVLAEVLGLDMTLVWRLAAAPGSLTGIEAWPDGAATIAFTNRN